MKILLTTPIEKVIEVSGYLGTFIEQEFGLFCDV